MDCKVALVLIMACIAASHAGPDIHSVYARDASAYGGMSFNKELPYVPRYRYKIRPYTNKRMDNEEMTLMKLLDFLMRDGN